VWEFDPTGNDIATSITKNGSVFLAHEQSADAQGRVLVEDGELMPWAREYSYDNADRLVQARERRVGAAATAGSDVYGCLSRSYGFAGLAGLNGNRRSQALFGANTATGLCSTAGTALSSTSYTIDAADRLSATGMILDAFGRTTAVPAGSATSGSVVNLGYYANDLVASIASGSQSRSYGLDPVGYVNDGCSSWRGLLVKKEKVGNWGYLGVKIDSYRMYPACLVHDLGHQLIKYGYLLNNGTNRDDIDQTFYRMMVITSARHSVLRLRGGTAAEQLPRLELR